MTILYKQHQSVFFHWRGTVLPLTWRLTLLMGFVSLTVVYAFDEVCKCSHAS